MNAKLLLILLLLWVIPPLHAQDPAGLWKTVDEKTGEVKSHVELFESNGQYYGKIVKVLQEDYIQYCDSCSGNKHGQAIEGLVIIEHVSTDEVRGSWRGGTILEPESGKTFSFSMWFPSDDPDVLKVRGRHWTGIYRTQTWYRLSD